MPTIQPYSAQKLKERGFPPTFEEFERNPRNKISLENPYYYNQVLAMYQGGSFEYPPDIGEATRPYYRNPKKQNAFTNFIHDNSTTMLKNLGKVAGSILIPVPFVGSKIGGEIAESIGKKLEQAHQEGGSVNKKQYLSSHGIMNSKIAPFQSV